MRIHAVLFVTSVQNSTKKAVSATMIKTFESNFRPMVGDIFDDPGFHPDYHNGYEVVKVTINYATNECYVSLSPLVIEKEDMETETYIKRLKTYGWREMSKDVDDELLVDNIFNNSVE